MVREGERYDGFTVIASDEMLGLTRRLFEDLSSSRLAVTDIGGERGRTKPHREREGERNVVALRLRHHFSGFV